MGNNMKSISEQIRQALLIVESATSTTPCDWDEQSHAFLFTQQDQDLFLAARNIHPTDVMEKISAMTASVKKKIPSADAQLRTRLPAPYVFGIFLKNPEQKDSVASELELSTFKHKPVQKGNTSCTWNSEQNMFMFSKSDLAAFAKNWNVKIAHSDAIVELSTECREAMQAILEKKGLTGSQATFVTRMPSPYWLGLRVANAAQKDTVAQSLALNC